MILTIDLSMQEDEKDHAAFCKRAQKGVTIPNWKNERLHKAFPDANGAYYSVPTSPALVSLPNAFFTLSSAHH